MKRTVILPLLICAALSTSGQRPDPEQSSRIFDKVGRVIVNKSRVPPMLPSVFPYIDDSHPLHALIQSIDDSSYTILLANALPCDGANWCLYGSVRGNVVPFRHSFNHISPKVERVVLIDGIKARFIKASCDAYCTEAYVEWTHGDYYYSIGLKAGERKELVGMANSAISSAKASPSLKTHK